MEQKEKDCGYWIAVLLVGLVFGVVAGLAIAGFAYPIYKSDKWAAWVQAFGSILAIGGSYFIGSYLTEKNHQLERLRRDEEAQKKVQGHYLLLSQVSLLATNVKNTLEEAWLPDGKSRGAEEEELAVIKLRMYWRGSGKLLARALLKYLEAIPLSDFDKPSDITLLITVIGALSQEVMLMDSALLSDDFTPDMARKRLSGLWNGMNFLCLFCSKLQESHPMRPI